MVSDADIPTPIDLRDRTVAAAWAAAADVKRPWRAEIRAHIGQLCGSAQRVLELGPGPGQLAEAILAAGAVERYTLVDFSSPMLAMSRTRLGAAPVDYLERDFTRADWTAGLTGYDAVVAMQSVHELRHKRHAASLYARVRQVLRPGGVLIVCDHEPAECERSRALYATPEEQHTAFAEAGFGQVTTSLVLRGLYVCSGRQAA